MSRASLRLESVPAGAAVFIDANIFIYHFLGISRECQAFLERCASGDVRAVTGAHIVAEVLHRLLIAEAKAKTGAGRKENAVRYLQEHPAEVRRLPDHHIAVAAIEKIVGVVLPLTIDGIRASQWARTRDGLLVNDSLTAAMLKGEGLAHLASHDAAFLGLDGLTVYRPGDLEIEGHHT
jgi:predicted nucleic acid-binding protein